MLLGVIAPVKDEYLMEFGSKHIVHSSHSRDTRSESNHQEKSFPASSLSDGEIVVQSMNRSPKGSYTFEAHPNILLGRDMFVGKAVDQSDLQQNLSLAQAIQTHTADNLNGVPFIGTNVSAEFKTKEAQVPVDLPGLSGEQLRVLSSACDGTGFRPNSSMPNMFAPMAFANLTMNNNQLTPLWTGSGQVMNQLPMHGHLMTDLSGAGVVHQSHLGGFQQTKFNGGIPPNNFVSLGMELPQMTFSPKNGLASLQGQQQLLNGSGCENQRTISQVPMQINIQSSDSFNEEELSDEFGLPLDNVVQGNMAIGLPDQTEVIGPLSDFEDDADDSIRKKSRQKRTKSFPEKLMDALMNNQRDDAVSWLPDGKSFVVVNDELFVGQVLSKEFKASKYSSFVRKLHRWGFVRLTSGTGTDCFHHPLFQKGREDLAAEINSGARAQISMRKRKQVGRGSFNKGTSQITDVDASQSSPTTRDDDSDIPEPDPIPDSLPFDPLSAETHGMELTEDVVSEDVWDEV